MIAFGITLFALFLLSLLSFNREQTFSKDKMPVLRAFMAFVSKRPIKDDLIL